MQQPQLAGAMVKARRVVASRLSTSLEAESHTSADVVLEAFAPAFTTFGAVHRLPVSKHTAFFANW